MAKIRVKLFVPTANRNPVVRPVAGHYIDWFLLQEVIKKKKNFGQSVIKYFKVKKKSWE